MLTDKEQKLLIRKKKIELQNLGINPNIYFLVTKFINRDYTFIIKNDKYYVFLNNIEVDDDDVSKVIRNVFSLKSRDSEIIVNEWTRDRIIYHNMMNNQKQCYDYLTLPLPHNNNDDEGYNF